MIFMPTVELFDSFAKADEAARREYCPMTCA